MGIPGVTVQLYNPDGTPADDSAGQPITGVTGPDGSYILTSVPEGEYVVKVDPDDGSGRVYGTPHPPPAIRLPCCPTTW